MTLVVLTLLMMTATAQTIKEGVYVIKSVSNPNYVLTLKNAQPGNGNPLSVEKWKNNNAQKWKVTIQDGYNVIRSMVDNNYVVDVNNVTPVDGREVYIYGFHGGDNQLWTPKSKGGLKVELLSKADKTFALTMTTDGKTQTWKDAGKNTQVWEFVHPEAMTTTTTTPTTTTSTNVIPDGVYIIKFAKDPNYVMTVKDGNATCQNIVHLWKWRNDNSQKWKVTTQNGKTVIRSMLNNNLVLDVRGNDICNETRIQVYDYHGGDNQLWVPEKQSNGTIVIMSYANKGFCIDLHYGNPSNDALIKLYQTHKDFEQQWTFQRIDGNTSTSSTTGSHLPRLAEEPKLTKIPDGIYYIVNPGEGFPLTMKKSGNKYTLGLDKRLRDKTQQWKVTNNSDGSMTIRSVLNTNYVIMVKDGVMKNGTRIECRKSEGQSHEHWFAYKHYHGVYTLKCAKDQKLVLRKNEKKGYSILRQLRKDWDQNDPWDWNEQWDFERVDIKPEGVYTDTDMSKYYRFFGHSFQVRVTGRTDGEVWGDNKQNGYMERTDLGTAAVHAGFVKPGETAVLSVGINYGWYKYWSTRKNSIQSKAYGWGRCRFWINKKVKTISSGSTPGTTTTPTKPTTPSATAPPTNRYYDVRCAKVVTKPTNIEGKSIVYFDDFGLKFRREDYQSDKLYFIVIIDGDNIYSLDPKTKTVEKRQDERLCWLDMSQINKKKFSKKGTATLLGQTCTIYSNSDSRYYVWKGMPLKGSDIYRAYEATSYTELNEVDPNLFKIPSDYTLK